MISLLQSSVSIGFKYVQEYYFVDNSSIDNNPMNIDYFIASSLESVNSSLTAPAVALAVPIMNFTYTSNFTSELVVIYQVMKEG